MGAVAKGQAILVVGHACKLAMSLAVASLLARNLVPADFAFVALVTTIFIVGGEVLDMGTMAISVRDVAAGRIEERAALGKLISARRGIGLGAALAVALLAQSGYVHDPDQRVVMLVVACGVFLLHLHAYQLVFQVRQAFGRLTALGLASQAAFLVASAVAVGARAGGAILGLFVVMREAFMIAGSRRMALGLMGERVHARWNEPGVKALLQAGWMVGLAGAAYKLAAYVGVFILWNAEPSQLASFSAAQRLLAPLGDMAWLFVTPLIAAMSTTASQGLEPFRLQLERCFKFLLAAAALVALSGYFLAPLLLRIIYGETYASGPLSAVGPVRWLAFGYLFAIASPVLVVAEIVHEKTRTLLVVALACLAVNLAVNAWAIPLYGAEGPAMAFVAAEAFVLAVFLARALHSRHLSLAGLVRIGAHR